MTPANTKRGNENEKARHLAPPFFKERNQD